MTALQHAGIAARSSPQHAAMQEPGANGQAIKVHKRWMAAQEKENARIRRQACTEHQALVPEGMSGVRMRMVTVVCGARCDHE